jgi:hypothetical protein
MIETQLYKIKNQLECALEALNHQENWSVGSVVEQAISDIQEVINAAECRDLTQLD